MTKQAKRTEMSVTKTVSLPFTVVEQIMDESELMNKSFSEATTVLLRIGISQRRYERDKENEILKK